jgi:hypothetical protein
LNAYFDDGSCQDWLGNHRVVIGPYGPRSLDEVGVQAAMRTLTKQLEVEVFSAGENVLWAVKSDSAGGRRARFLGTDLWIIPNFPMRLSLWDNFSASERKSVAESEWKSDRFRCISSHVSGLYFEYVPCRTFCTEVIEFDQRLLRDAANSTGLPDDEIRILAVQGFQVLNQFEAERSAPDGIGVRVCVHQTHGLNDRGVVRPESRAASQY